MMNIGKVKEIKKALEYCYNGCDGECYRNNNGEDYYDCRDGLLLVALELINELERENKWLRLDNDVLIGKKKVEKQKYDNALIVKIDIQEQLKERIAELEKENKDYYDRLNNLQSYIDNHEEIWKRNTKTQLQQFAERLKEKVHERDYVEGYAEIGLCEEIDATLKEFIAKKFDNEEEE